MNKQDYKMILPPAVTALMAAIAVIAALSGRPALFTVITAGMAAVSAGLCIVSALKLRAELTQFLQLCGTSPDSPEGSAAQRLRRHLEGNARKLIAVEQQKSDLGLQIQLIRQRSGSMESILDTICDAVLVSDDKDRIVQANLASQELLGFAFAKDSPLDAGQITACPELSRLIAKTRCSRAARVRHELQIEKDAGPVFLDAVFSCLEDSGGRVLQVVTVLHDVTRQKEIAKMKNDFVSHVSHELKTPLASINAYAEMLVDGEARDAETLHQFCSIIQGQAERLNRLIEDILNISRIESGLIKVNRQDHSLAMVIRDAAAMITGFAQEKNITVTAPAPILYDQVYIDRDMISQVVINLLSNAVKYTPAGGQITIDSQVNENDGQVTVTITDTGVGIPAEAIGHVFDKFYRVESNNKYAKGTGLGLNLARQIVETVHGGKVFVTSTPGKGSTFGFVLPLSKETAVRVS
ncbi:MAG: hypothetical protein LLF76_09395 [Planctomycetaceae bacterium]|nr:hypothetical protein [Planctomycetaceae bacterium]